MKKMGIIVLIVLWIFSSCLSLKRQFAPKFEATGSHERAEEMTEVQCLDCHRDGKERAPKAPKSMLERKNCIFCHLKQS
jgi:thioredoxin-related protein